MKRRGAWWVCMDVYDRMMDAHGCVYECVCGECVSDEYLPWQAATWTRPCPAAAAWRPGHVIVRQHIIDSRLLADNGIREGL